MVPQGGHPSDMRDTEARVSHTRHYSVVGVAALKSVPWTVEEEVGVGSMSELLERGGEI